MLEAQDRMAVDEGSCIVKLEAERPRQNGGGRRKLHGELKAGSQGDSDGVGEKCIVKLEAGRPRHNGGGRKKLHSEAKCWTHMTQ